MIESCVVSPRHGSPAHAFIKSGVPIYLCPSCGCIMADLKQFVHAQYEAGSYYTMSFAGRREIEAQWGFRWRYILHRLERYSERPRILDVGAGNGYFVYLARCEFGLHADGIEISKSETAYAREMFGIDFIGSELQGVQEHYDVVGSFNVLEHVTDPALLLAQMSEKVRPGGYLVLTTPSPACIHRRVLGLQRWGMVCPPHHINLFPRPALEEILSSAGFTVLEYATLSTYINFVRRIDTRRLLLRRAAFRLLKAARLGADHFVVCRKSGSAQPSARRIAAPATSA